MTDISLPTIAIVGGTGQLGAAIARRLAKAGCSVIIGSRDSSKARLAAEALALELGREVGHGANVAAATAAGLIIVAVPFASQAITLQEIAPVVAGKIVVDL